MAIYVVGMSGERERAAERLSHELDGLGGVECWLGTFVIDFPGSPEDLRRAAPSFADLGSGFIVEASHCIISGRGGILPKLTTHRSNSPTSR
jgi:hypothetical protein